MKLMPFLLKTLTFPFVVIGKIWAGLFGKVSWSMPPWLVFIFNLGKRSPANFLVVIAVLFGLGFFAFKTYDYYQSLPEPILVDAIITIPNVYNGDTFNNESQDDRDKLPSIKIEFSYTHPSHDFIEPEAFVQNTQNTQRMQTSIPQQLPSVAPINLVGARVNTGITLRPHKAGTWQWDSDRTLSFIPKTPWPAGQEYEVRFAPEVFDTQDKFTNDQFSFVTQALTGEIETSEFELSVEDKVKQVYVEIRFNYPVVAKSVEQALIMAYQEEGNKLGNAQKFTLSFSDDLRTASAILPVPELPDQPRIIQVKFGKGIKSIYGGEATTRLVESKIVVPDLYSFLKLERSTIEILRNPQNEPEQFILLSFTDLISRTELLDKFSLYMLPNKADENSPEKGNKKHWQSPREVTAEVLGNAEKVEFVVMPNANSSSKHYHLKIDVSPERQLYIKIDSGLRSANGFIQRAFFDQIFSAPKYPQEVIIAGEGSVLTHSKDQRLAFSTRGIQNVQVSIGKVIDDELYHLVSQTQGDISNPNFYNWRFNETNLAEFTTQYISMNANNTNLKSANYASVDLNKLVSHSKGGLGLFFVEIKGWDSKRQREIHGVNDKLLVLVTDLGVIVKTSQNDTQDIFVQSISSGTPAVGARVELIAKNGTKLFSKTTNNQGHISFPSASSYTNEKQPVVYVVKQKGDVSFIPYNRYTRQINYSRFNVGGEYTYGGNAQRVNAYMFTDRGIYRPGESVNIGMIVKGKDLKNLGDIPLELVIRDAQYNEMYVERISLPEFGFTEAKFNTEKSFKTGNYSATLHLVRDRKGNSTANNRDHQVGNLTFDVEEFQADTMSITSEVQDLPSKGWAVSPALVNDVTLNNLSGVPAQGRRVASNLKLQPIQFSFDEFKDVAFYAPKSPSESTNGLQRINEDLKDQTTNADGQASIAIDLSRFTKGTYNLSIQIKGFEASSGRSVGTSTSLLYSPASYLVGFTANGKLDFINVNSERSLELIAINNSLSPIALTALTQRLSKVQNVSTLVKQYNGRYQYESILKHEVIKEQDYALPAGFEKLALDTSSAGTFVIDILDENGEVIISMQYTVVGASNDSGQLDKNAELKVTLNKSDYQEGDTIKLSIQAPYAGSGLISIESDKLHSFKWFTSPSKNSVQSISIPEGIEGNAYINVAFVRDLASKEIFTSPLSYAVVPFSIDRTKRTLDLALSVEDTVQPGKPMAINLSLSQDAKVAVFAVDAGILQVAGYRTPDPLAHFFKKRALNVRTMQIFDLILPDFALTQMLSAAGGDIEADIASSDMLRMRGWAMSKQRSANPFERKVQDPAIFWSGVIDGKKGDNTYTFDVPNDFAGALRIMAIAVGEQTMGRAQENTLVRGPFVLTANVLNQAAPGDEFDVTLSVANVIKGSPNNATVNISTSTSEHISIVGDTRAQMQLSENQEDAVRFTVKANDILGGASISFTVNTSDAEGKTWQSSRTTTLSIRPAMPFEVNVTTGVASNGKVALNTPVALFQAESMQMISASASPLVINEGLSAYLDKFPHGCTEQIVSQVFPLIGLSNIPKYSPNNEKVTAHFNRVMGKLRQRQSYAGGFSYWPSAQQNDTDVSVYVMHFLIEAQALGYAVPQDMLQSGVRYLNDTASAYFRANSQNKGAIPSLRDLRQRAKLVYLLTRSGAVTSNLLIDLVSTLENQHKAFWRKDIVSAYIAASYKLMEQTKEAKQLINSYDLSDQALMVDQAFAGMAPRITLDAQYLFLVAKHFPQQLAEISPQAILNITQAIYKGEYNTISAAYSMLALGAYHSAVSVAADNSASTNKSLAVMDQKIAFVALAQQKQTPLEVRYNPFASALYPVGTERVEASLYDSAVGSKGGLYYVNMQAGYQTLLPTQALSNGIEIQKAFINKNGEIATTIIQGDELKVRLRVRASEQKNIANIAIVDLLPGGFEVIRESVERKAGLWQSDYIDIREDRIIFYGSISNRVTEISYTVKVTAAGTFTVPPSFAEAMYDRSVKAYSASSSAVVEALE
jgi:uncharacterized protein YfaS (alpha-2-macroglobulin family)